MKHLSVTELESQHKASLSSCLAQETHASTADWYA